MARHTRAAWGARAPRSTTRIALPSVGVSWHWGGPAVGITSHTQCAGKVRQWQNFHMDSRGWADIAYSMLVCPHGDVYEGRGVRNRTAANGTNAGNASHHAVCYLGGQGEPLTDDGKRGMLDARAWLREGGAGGDVNCHRDHKSTECPGQTIVDWERAGSPAPDVPPAPAPLPVSAEPVHLDVDMLPTLSQALGSAGPHVLLAQAALVHLHTHDLSQEGGIDGSFGPGFHREVASFQQARGLSGAGVIGPTTWRLLLGLGDDEMIPVLGQSYTKSGKQVRLLQAALVHVHTHDLSQEGGIDGAYGPGVHREVASFQAARGLAADGIVGQKTWQWIVRMDV